VVTTQGPIADRDEPGVIHREIDIELLSLVSSGYDVEQIVQRLRLPLSVVHRRLVQLRRVIDDVSRSPSRR
jgi:hypothetical protein